MSFCRMLFAVTLATIVVCHLISTASSSPSQMPPRPTRPEKFTNSREVHDYAKKLMEYYSIIGRGRYGKRSLYPVLQRSYLPLPDRNYMDILEYLAQQYD